MITARPELIDILRIGREASIRGAGLSLREALRAARYHERRPSFEAADFRPLLKADPSLAEEWLAYSEDKRTTGGWYVLRSGEIGRATDKESRRLFDSLDEAVAEYVVRELDFWSGRWSWTWWASRLTSRCGRRAADTSR